MTYEQIKESIAKRDEIDKNKKEGALKVAPDALYIDTSDLTIDNVCDIILRQINK
jgi:cytidylate kinase